MSQIRLEALKLASGFDNKSVDKTLEVADQIADYIQYGSRGKPLDPSEPTKKVSRKKLKLPAFS